MANTTIKRSNVTRFGLSLAKETTVLKEVQYEFDDVGNLQEVRMNFVVYAMDEPLSGEPIDRFHVFVSAARMAELNASEPNMKSLMLTLLKAERPEYNNAT